MNGDISSKRHKSHFHKGMTLEEYLRGMDLNDDTLPTADSAVGPFAEEENLYKTSHFFHRTKKDSNSSCIRQTQQQNFDDSLEHQRQSANIASSNLQPFGKKTNAQNKLMEEQRKNYRIRNGKSISPYHQQIMQAQTKTINPYKTFMKKMYKADNQQKHNEENKKDNKSSLIKTLYRKEQELRKSMKSVRVESIFEQQNKNYTKIELTEDNKKLSQIQKINVVDLIQTETDKVDIRIETLKDRLQMRRKHKIKY